MKAIFTFLLIITFLGSIQLQAQDEIKWADPIQVSTTGDDSPVIKILEDGTPVAIWGHRSAIYFSRLDGNMFTTPKRISTGGISPSVYSFGGLDMAVRRDQIHIVFENYTRGIFYIRSSDGGATFDSPVSVYDPPSGRLATLATIAVNDSGNPLISVIIANSNESGAKYYMMRSLDGGKSFNPPVVATGPTTGDLVCECCPSDIYTKNDDVWLVFRSNDFDIRDMWVSKSTDGGETFNEAVDVDATDWFLNLCPISGPSIETLGGDSLLTIWKSGASGIDRVYISTLNGVTMEKGLEMVIPQFNNNSQQSSADVAGANDTIGIVWAESGFGANKTDIVFAFSNNGSTDLLSTKTNITEKPGSQGEPSLVFANGSFHLINTDGSGGIEYRKGVLGKFTSTKNYNSEILNIEIIQQPVLEGLIKLKNNGQDKSVRFNVQLTDFAGKTLKTWNSINSDPNGIIYLETKEIPIGMYFLNLNSIRGHWVGKLLMVE